MSYVINSKNMKKQMKKKRKRIIDYGIIIVLIILLLIIAFSTNVVNIQKISENVRRQLYGDPIDLETGLINNDYFGISSDGKNAEETTKGLNEAIEYASKNSINYIKIQAEVTLRLFIFTVKDRNILCPGFSAPCPLHGISGCARYPARRPAGLYSPTACQYKNTIAPFSPCAPVYSDIYPCFSAAAG